MPSTRDTHIQLWTLRDSTLFIFMSIQTVAGWTDKQKFGEVLNRASLVD